MTGWRLLALVMLATGSLAMSSASVAGAGTSGWTTFYPVHVPVTFNLPATWEAAAPPQGSRFYAQTPLGDANVMLNVSQYQGAASGFVADMYSRARQVYLAQDPQASVRSRKISLPAGEGFEVIGKLVRKLGSRSYPLSVESYVFLHGHQAYEFVYTTLTPKAASYFPTFDLSAHSIRFK